MPRYRVDDPDGSSYIVKLEKAPSSQNEISSMVDRLISGETVKGASILNLKQTTPEDFLSQNGGLQTLGEEVSGGLSEMTQPAEGLSQGNVNFDLPPAIRGAARIASAPFVAGGAAVGYPVLRATGSPAAAAVADAATQTGMTMGLAPMGRALQRGAQFLPGAGNILREEATVASRAIPGELTAKAVPGIPAGATSDELYALAREANIEVPDLPRFNKIAKTVAGENAELASRWGLSRTKGAPIAGRSTQTLAKAGTIEPPTVVKEPGTLDLLTEPGAVNPPVTANEVLDVKQALYRDLQAAKAAGKSRDVHDLSRMFDAIRQDLAEAHPALGVAEKAYKREQGIQELIDILEPAVKSPTGETLERGNFKQMLEKLRETRRKDPRFEGSFEPGELDQIQAALKEANSYPAPRGPRGTQYGFGARAAFTGLGTLGGYAVGHSGQAMGIGAAIGTQAPAIIAEALRTDFGRNLFLRLVRAGGGVLSGRGISILNAALQGQRLSAPVEEPSQP